MSTAHISEDKKTNDAKVRAKKIKEYINNNKKECETGLAVSVFEFGKLSTKPVYKLPRYLVRLNPNNGRFRSELDLIEKEREKEGKIIELDSENKSDIESLRLMIRGENPLSPERKNAYRKLFEDIKNVAEDTGTNGQLQPGIITYDGILVNGNRRECVMEELSVNSKGREGKAITFGTINVGILDEEADDFDIWQNEAREQISQELREEYDYVNSALEIRRGIEKLEKGKRKLLRAQAINEVHRMLGGRSRKEISEYLEFLDVADWFLNLIKKEGNYHYIQESSEGEGGIITILKEIKKARDQYEQEKILGKPEVIRESHLSALFTVLAKKKILNPLTKKPYPFNQREFRKFKSEALAEDAKQILVNSDFAKKIDWDHPELHVGEFHSLIQRARALHNAKESISEPARLLQQASDTLKEIIQALNGSERKSIIDNIKQNHGDEHIKSIKTLIGDISKKLLK